MQISVAAASFAVALTAAVVPSVVAQSASTVPGPDGVPVPSDCSAGLDGKLPSQVPSTFFFSGNVRTYYIAAEQVGWNYVPSGYDNWLGVPIQDSPRAKSAGYLKSIGGAGGFEFQKALYRGYTDATFSNYSEVEPTAGVQGPTIRAEVGDLVQVAFKNKLPMNYASIHSMGLSYSKENEGSIYANTTTGGSPRYSGEEAVPPGGCVVYKWFVTPSSAPPAGELSQAWSYHSFVNMRADLDAGLMGPVIVYASGQMNRTMAEYREYPVLFYIFNEGNSFMANTNALMYGDKSLQEMATNASTNTTTLENPYNGNTTIWTPQLANYPAIMLSSDQAPSFSSINGVKYANGPAFEMCQGDSVIWYYYAFGKDSHTFHMHGDNFKIGGVERAVLSANDGEMFALYMDADLPGVWQLICHVNDHLSEGMEKDYQIYPADACPLPPLRRMA